MNSQTQKNSPKWDTEHSTFYWRIYLDPNHAQNNPDVKHLDGHSKQRHQKENSDLVILLRRKIINLHNNGYFKRMQRIAIKQKTDFAIDKRKDPTILILYPTHYEIPPLNQATILKLHGSWLERFYECINKNLSMESLLPTGRKIVSQDQYLDITKFHFRNIAQLYSHAARLLLNGHPEGSVNHFIERYKELKKW